MEARKSGPRAVAPASEERAIPLVRATLARKLAERGYKVGEIAMALKVTQPAVTQYLGGKRGVSRSGSSAIDALVDPLAEKLSGRIRSGVAIEAAELLEAARQIVVMNSGRSFIARTEANPERGRLLGLLRSRLQLELDAAERYLELASRTPDDYTKLLFRMIAGDSIRHGDVVSQLISWLEAGGKSEGSIPDEGLLRCLLAVEDSAGEASLVREVGVDHPVARLLLRWIDMDERKHEKMVDGLLSLQGRRRGPRRAPRAWPARLNGEHDGVKNRWRPGRS